MKTVYAIAALAAFNLATAQKTTELKEFKSLTVGADVKVKLVKSTQNKLVITGNDDELQIENEGGGLALTGDGNDITVYYTAALESIAAASDSEVYGTDEIRVKELRISAASDAKIKLTINVEKLNTVAASDADVVLSGTATEHNATLASDASLKAENLLTENTNIVVATDASAAILAKGTVNATVSSDGSLKIHGKPKKVNETKNGDASIVMVN